MTKSWLDVPIILVSNKNKISLIWFSLGWSELVWSTELRIWSRISGCLHLCSRRQRLDHQNFENLIELQNIRFFVWNKNDWNIYRSSNRPDCCRHIVVCINNHKKFSQWHFISYYEFELKTLLFNQWTVLDQPDFTKFAIIVQCSIFYPNRWERVRTSKIRTSKVQKEHRKSKKFEKDQNVESQIRLSTFWSFLTP